jgi:hypothetical protein
MEAVASAEEQFIDEIMDAPIPEAPAKAMEAAGMPATLRAARRPLNFDIPPRCVVPLLRQPNSWAGTA